MAMSDLKHTLRGHLMVGKHHTGVLHARALSASGRRREALTLLESLALVPKEEVTLFHARLVHDLENPARALEVLGENDSPAVNSLRDELRRAAATTNGD
jgi:hypothetical protein